MIRNVLFLSISKKSYDFNYRKSLLKVGTKIIRLNVNETD